MKPADLGLPFGSFRRDQLSSIRAVVGSDKPVVFYEGPVGSGKSGVAIGAINYTSDRGIILTADIALQQQYMKSFPETLMMVGRSHFPCIIIPSDESPQTAETAPCVGGYKCPERVTLEHPSGRCPYYAQRHNGLLARLTVTNYAMFLSLVDAKVLPYGGVGPYDFIVCDEGHKVEEMLLAHIGAEIHLPTVRSVPLIIRDTDTTDAASLRAWAKSVLPELRDRIEQADHIRRGRWGRLQGNLEKLLLVDNADNWLVSETRTGWLVRPVLAPWAFRKYLLGQSHKVLVMSGTLPPPAYQSKTLGLAEDEYVSVVSPMRFPVGRRPIHVLADGPRVSARDDESIREAITLVDDFLRTHQDAKGLIHTGNFNITQRLKLESKYSKQIISYDTEHRREAIAQFKLASAPRYLAGPSLSEGLDLPYELVTHQLLMKLPIPDLSDPWVTARRKVDKDWDGWVTARSVAQAYGRGIRASDDWCDFWVLDSNFSWHLPRYRQFYPRWFKEAIVSG